MKQKGEKGSKQVGKWQTNGELNVNKRVWELPKVVRLGLTDRRKQTSPVSYTHLTYKTSLMNATTFNL